MARTDNRLDLDANLVGYWGFDEALETDNAIDESQYADAHLTVSGSTSVQLGRVGAARTLSGGAYATVSNARLRLMGDATIMAWFRLASVNNAGSLLRALISCGGPTTGDNQLFGVYVDNGGRLVYKHTSASGEVVVRTASNVIRIGQFYNIAVVRSSGGTQLQFIVDNFVVPVADVTVNGGSSSLPVPAPSSNASSVFSIGRSQKEADSAFWDGIVDEVTLHDIARPHQPYLKSVYFRAALRSSTNRLSATNSIDYIASSDMGSGVRWWCYERDKELYVVKESPFGFFGVETRLTTPGGVLASNNTSPELIYDRASDTLLVVFVASNRIFKLTATSTDDPATINMPYTADAGSVLKLVDNVEKWRGSEGYGGQREIIPTDYVSVNRTPIKLSVVEPTWDAGEGTSSLSKLSMVGINTSPHKPSIAFVTDPALGFGIQIAAPDSTQFLYKVYIVDGGLALPAGTSPTLSSQGYRTYFFAIASRVEHRQYIVEALDESGQPTGNATLIEDEFNDLVANGSAWVLGSADKPCHDSFPGGEGYGGQREWLPTDYSTTNRTPLKFAIQEPTIPDFGEASGGQHGFYVRNGLTVQL